MTQAKRTSTKHSLMHIMIELFFSILPLIVLGVFWLESEKVKFIESPEWSMMACILYGLSLTRFQNAISGHIVERGPAVSFISVLPLLGVILSIILMSSIINGTGTGFSITAQFINLFLSIICFIILGGYGVSRSS